METNYKKPLCVRCYNNGKDFCNHPTDEIVGWEKEFDKTFQDCIAELKDDDVEFIVMVKGWEHAKCKHIKDFIRQTIATSQQALVEKIEGKLPSNIPLVGESGTVSEVYYANGRRHMLAAVKEILRKMR